MKIRQAFWRLVHKMPCAVVHRVCDLCRSEDMCARCWERKTAHLDWETTTGPHIMLTPVTAVTLSGATTVTYRYP